MPGFCSRGRRGHQHILGMAGISKSVTEEGQRLLGYPAIDIKDYFRSYAVYKKLPDLVYRLRELEKKLGDQALHPAETPHNGQNKEQ